MANEAYADSMKTRVEANVRYGDDRTIAMSEFWAPLFQTDDSVFYTDFRIMGDDAESREGNLGFGYRQITDLPLLGHGVAGLNAWMDRRTTENDNIFYQTTLGAEWFGDFFDLRSNIYIGLSDPDKSFWSLGAGNGTPYFAGTGIFVDSMASGESIEEIQNGGDAEIGFTLPVLQDYTDSVRFYTGGYYFEGEHSGNIAGWRTRLAVDVTSDFQVGVRAQRDDERGSQGFLEATIRFPFKNKKSYRREGLVARLDESPERDIDIVTGKAQKTIGSIQGAGAVPLLNEATGTPQRVLHVDNSAASAGNGSKENPYNTLSAAEAASQDNNIIYVHPGTGTSLNQDQGITLAHQGLRLIGSGANLYYEAGKFLTTGSGAPSSYLIAPATTAPVITNNQANGDGITIAANDVGVAGLRINNASRDGIAVLADGASASAMNVMISDVIATGNRTGINIHGSNGGSVSAAVQKSIVTGNDQHGIAVYDDTNGTFDVDLGGGTTSIGLNSFTGNGFEDVAVDYDGRTLMADNNWWGQAGGPTSGQVYFGSALDDNLVGHWLLDETAGSTAAERIAGHDGTVMGGSNWSPAGGQLTGAIELNAAWEQYIDVADYDNVDTGDKLSVSYWINPDDLEVTATHIGKWIPAGVVSSWGIRGSNSDAGELLFFIAAASDGGDNYFLTNNMDLVSGVWANISFVYDGAGATNADRLKIYKDGMQVSGTFGGTIPSTLNNTNLPLSFGRKLVADTLFGRYADGLMDDIRIYRDALSPDEIGQITRSRSDSILQTGSSLSTAP